MHFHLSQSGEKAEVSSRDSTERPNGSVQLGASEDDGKIRVGSFLLIDPDLKLPYGNIDWAKHTGAILNLAMSQQDGETKRRILELLSHTSPEFISTLLEGRSFSVKSDDSIFAPLKDLQGLGILDCAESFHSLDPVEKFILPVSFLLTSAFLFLTMNDVEDVALTIEVFFVILLVMAAAFFPSLLLGAVLVLALNVGRSLIGIEEPGETIFTYSLKEDGRKFIQEEFYPVIAKYIRDERI